jgi:hypothetical protein
VSEKNKQHSVFGVLEPHEIKDIIVNSWGSLIDVAGTMHDHLPTPAAVLIERGEHLIQDVTGVIKGIGGAAVHKIRSDKEKNK